MTIRDSRLRQLNAVKGDNNIIAEMFVNMRAVETERFTNDEKALVSFLTELPGLADGDPTPSAFTAADLEQPCASLRRDHLLLISCVDATIARAAASALLVSLDIAIEQRKLLSFDRIDVTDFVPQIHELASNRVDPATAAVTGVVIDAVGDKAQRFLDSLLNTIGGAWLERGTTHCLSNGRVFVICLVDAERIRRRLNDEQRELPFAHWPISFLRHLLQSHIPDRHAELEAIIVRQRASGKWSRNESDFCHQIRDHLGRGDLPSVVEQGGASHRPAPSEVSPYSQHPTHNTALYVATFFPDLGPHEFDRVVTALLGDRTTTIHSTVQQKPKDGSFDPVAVETEKPLIQVWREGSDAILRQCGLVTTRPPHRVIAFAEAGQREILRESLEENYGLGLQQLFTALLNSGFLFDASKSISRNVVRLTADMAISYPDLYGPAWVAELVTKARRKLAASADSLSDEPILRLLRKPNGLSAQAQVHERIAQLLRVTSESMEPFTGAVLEQLLSGGSADLALELVKLLHFAPSFDSHRWLKQLIDRGGTAVGAQAYSYVYRELKRVEPHVYPLLRILEGWLPRMDADTPRYSPANTAALHLLLEYALETTALLEAKHYGAWPSVHPLLAVRDAKAATADFDLLMRWLLHPGLKHVMTSEYSERDLDRLRGAVISEWAFIILGPTGGATGDDGTISPEQALAILLERLLAMASSSQQRHIEADMLGYWHELSDFLALLWNVYAPTEQHQRDEFVWKRSAVVKLITAFRRLQPPPDHRPSTRRRSEHWSPL